MHISHSIYVNQPIQLVTDALIDEPVRWFPKSVGLHLVGLPVHKNVTIAFGQPVMTASWAELPLTWRATFPEGLFPVMTGKVVLVAISKNETRLTVSGMYEPPLGGLGAQLDATLMHNVAEGTVRELAKSLGDQLEKGLKASRS